MDITYLLWLQDFRNSIDNALTPFMEELSLFALTWLLFVPVFVYWCLNKRDGLFLIVSLGISWFFNGVVKLTVCAFRPWVRDARIIPAGNAINTAGGFSFPSGHTMWATPIYGGVAVLCRKSAAIISYLCIALILLTAFSRNYLGVHTPQDVLAGTCLGLLAIYITTKILAYLANHPWHENMLLIIGLILCAASLVYITTKSYPNNVVNGKVQFDPVAIMNDSFHGAGFFAGVILGRFVERKFVNFTSTGLGMKGIVLALVGFVPYYFIIFIFTKKYTFLLNALTQSLGMHGGYFVLGFITMFYAVAVWPMIIKLCERKK